MGHPQLWLGESFNLTCRQASRLIETTKLSRPQRSFHQGAEVGCSTICRLDPLIPKG